MDLAPLFVLALVAFAAIAFGSWYFSADQRALRAIRAVPERPIGEVADGEKVRVTGRVELGETVASPFTGRRCAYWRVTVREQRRSGKSSHWVTIIEEHGGVDFFLLDETGKALVRAQYVTPVLDKDRELASGFLNDPTPELEAFLHSHGHSAQGWVFNKALRYYEGTVESGEIVSVVGIGRWERDPDASARAGQGYRDAELPKRLVVESPDDGPLLLTDRGA